MYPNIRIPVFWESGRELLGKRFPKLETLRTTYAVTRRHIPEDLDTQLHLHENLKTPTQH